MSKRGDVEFLKDILEAIKRVAAYTSGMEYKDFLDDIKTQDAVIRNIEIIGEAAKNVSDDFKLVHVNIEWRKIAGMRDRIIHFYFGVNWDIVWDVIRNRLPALGEEVEVLLGERSEG